MPEITIVNTSPLFYLYRLGLLKVLNKLYGHITVPEAVKKELEEGKAQGKESLSWKIIHTPPFGACDSG